VLVACDGDTPVAAGTLFVRGDVASLAGGATLPSHQRRGAQGALLAERIEIARHEGCRFVTSETGVIRRGEPNHSYRNMVRVGLRPVYLRHNFAPRGTAWTAP
jgi:GNAT superfamily N-acetyltransferase